MHNISKSFDLYRIDNNFIRFCRSKFTESDTIIINMRNNNLKIEIISTEYNIKVFNKSRELNYNKYDTIKILYGLSENESINVTDIIVQYLDNNKILNTTTNINKILGDPFLGKFKKLFIYMNNSENPNIIIEESKSHLLSNLILFGNINKIMVSNSINNNISLHSIPNVLIYLIYHDDKSYNMIEKYKDYPYIKLFYNESTKYFESNIFNYLNQNRQEWTGKDYIGIITYSFENKMKMDLDNIYNNIINNIYNNYDLIILFDAKINLYQSFHGKLCEIFNYTLHKFGFKMPFDYRKVPMFFCNYFITKTEWMAKYVNFAIKYMEKLNDKNDNFLQILLNSDIGYTVQLGAKLSEKELLQLTEFPYYTHHSFLMERLPCLYFWKKHFVRITNNETIIQAYKHNYKKPQIYLISHQMDYSGAPIYLCSLKSYLESFDYNVVLLTISNGTLSNEYPSIQVNKQEAMKIILQECFDWQKYINCNKNFTNFTQDKIINHVISNEFNEKQKIYFHKPFIIFCNTIVTYEYVNFLSKLRMPVYWILHECQRDMFFEQLNNNNLYSAFLLATNVIHMCHSVRNIYRYIPQNKSLVIFNGLNFNDIQNKYDQNICVREKFNILSDDILICIIGTISNRKRQILFIESVFSKLLLVYNNIKLLLVGSFIDINETDFDNRIQKFKNNIIYTGEVKNAIPYIKESDIYVCYSELECFPISNLEAMFCEKAIVSTNVFGICEQFTHEYDAFLFDVNDSDKCYTYLENFINDDNLRKYMGKNAKNTLLQKFNSEIKLKKYIDLIEDPI